MNTGLFRQEAVAHQSEPVRGSVLLATSPRSTWLAMVAFAVAASLVLFGWLGEFNRKAKVQGYLAPDKGLIKVYPQVAGTLLDRRVEDGQQVKRGDILAVISTERASLHAPAAHDTTLELLSQRRASLEKERESRRSLLTLRRHRLAEQQASLQAERQQLDAAIRTLEDRLRAAEREVGRFERLQNKGFVAETQLQQQRDHLLDQRGRLQVLVRDRIAVDGRLTDLVNERRAVELEGETELAALERRISEIMQEQTGHEANSDVIVAAPTDGIVSTVLLNLGQRVQPDAPLLSIIPSSARLEAKLLVPSHAIGFIAPQQSVALRYAAFPYQRFGHHEGLVRSVSKSLLLPHDADLPMVLSEPAYLVTVDLAEQSVQAYGKRFPLRTGMAIDADVMLDRRSIIEWVFEPLFSLTGRS